MDKDEFKARQWDGWQLPWYPRYADEDTSKPGSCGRRYASSWVAVSPDGEILAVLVGPDWSAESATQELERKHAGCTVRECRQIAVHYQWNLHDWQGSALFAAEEG